MNQSVATLLSLLDIERLEENLFRATGAGGETSRRIFGGQVVAQALAAASHTVADRACHSLHAYFLRPGDPSIPVIYEVDRARDGGSFTTRRVIAIQHGRQIFNMAASFHRDEDGPAHEHPAPAEVPPPDRAIARTERLAASAHRVPEGKRADYLRPSAIEVREIDPYDMTAPAVSSDRQRLWFRVARPVAGPDWLHRCLLAYASDMFLLGSALRPHALSWLKPDVMSASLDHAVWFHRPVRFDAWHLYVTDSPFAGGGRAFCRGAIYDESGARVASTAQEGLMRPFRRSAP